MKKRFPLFVKFILNPLSGFIFYFICVSLFLYIPFEGIAAMTFVLLIPFVLIIIIGLNLPFFSILFGRFTMSKRKKQNHTLEHGTIYYIKKKFGDKKRTGGSAWDNGFRIWGVSEKSEIIDAFKKFTKEFNRKRTEFFISSRCGSNIITSQGFGLILLTISALFLKLFKISDLIITFVLSGNVLLYFLLRKNLGYWIQEKLFMGTDFSSAKIHSINKVHKKNFWEKNPVYYVKTIIQ